MERGGKRGVGGPPAVILAGAKGCSYPKHGRPCVGWLEIAWQWWLDGGGFLEVAEVRGSRITALIRKRLGPSGRVASPERIWGAL